MFDGDDRLGMYSLPLLIWHPAQLVIGSFMVPRLKRWVEAEVGARNTSLKIGPDREEEGSGSNHNNNSRFSKNDTRVLDGVSFDCRLGEVTAVVGPVGSGKSSLLMALLGELPSFSSSRGNHQQQNPVTFSSPHSKHNCRLIAYASQEPFILSGTVRSNILFGSKFDPAK
jgi:ABC-type transport system involved in cytochrome bd biosynthesis fused ATPase/permease subunit